MQVEQSSAAMLANMQAQCAGADWIVYTEGYAFTGFAKLSGGVFTMPPAVEGVPNPVAWADIDWEAQFEVRVFGEGGEFHARCLSPGRWRTRFATSAVLKGWEWKQTILAGDLKERAIGWDRLSEANGINYWIPGGLVAWKDNDDRAALCVAEQVDFDENGLAYVKDAALRRIRKATDDGEGCKS